MGKIIDQFQDNLDALLKTGIAKEKFNRQSLNKISNEWKKLINGQRIDRTVVSDLIYNSWKRCQENAVDPYHQNEEFFTKEQVEKLVKNNEMLIRKFGTIIQDVQRIARKKGLTVQLFNDEAKNVQLIALASIHSQDKVALLTDVSEKALGTNAICLALRENRPVQTLGPEHYNYNLHDVFCSAAPLHDSKGNKIGVINIASYNYRQSTDNFILVNFLAKLLDNISLILDTMDELESYHFAINETFSYLSQGMLYVDHEDEIKYFNKKVTELFAADSTRIKERISDFLALLKEYNDDIQNEIIEMEIGGIRKHLIVTVKKFVRPNAMQHEKIIIVEERKSSDSHFEAALYTFDNIIGQNEKVLEAKHLANKVAKSNSSILIFGDNGTGKEVFAQAIHNASSRKSRPFVAINCGAIPHELVESELFGYEAGAFTGAVKGGRKGKLEIASGGTLFLDEIESMPLNMQVKLLRALSSKKICRVGGEREIPIDVRIISATKKDLLKEADIGNFRDDLYYRISTVTITLPALRECIDDIPLLTNHFIAKYAQELRLSKISVNPAFYDALSQYAWRGNVRELSNVIERSLLMLDDEKELNLKHLPEKVVNSYNYKSVKSKLAVINTQKTGSDNLMKLSEEIIIELLLKEENGTLSKVAERMGVCRQTLYNKISNSEKLKSKISKKDGILLRKFNKNVT
ncbi:Anaerobic nitric oxide reductase transcription regulator NorR [Sporomusa silvacetica DSM 10669]|uniref:Anaerobic nitric oxide reductase transcription regulator NorR n=1 Tax=Sporomusa silvacetica DSM 10669 TaxID=1123289 RepID=A0ABZ3IP86_9FIRM|nr:sigma 54-interacting transcriptional regulator [Sporomusa silvacetica]OZC19873.1 limonene hydroxylase [Sporomusa silvacetica DSM 10669]